MSATALTTTPEVVEVTDANIDDLRFVLAHAGHLGESGATLAEMFTATLQRDSQGAAALAFDVEAFFFGGVSEAEHEQAAEL